MVTTKKIALPATVAASAPAPVKAKAAPQVVPTQLPARKRTAAKKITVTQVAVKQPVLPEKAATSEKTRKPKLVRDSFTIPKAEYAVLDELKQRAALLARPAKKSELLRAGIKLLAALPDAQLLAALAKVPTIKTGRPTLGK